MFHHQHKHLNLKISFYQIEVIRLSSFMKESQPKLNFQDLLKSL